MSPIWLFLLFLSLFADGSKCLQNRRRTFVFPGRGGSVRTASSVPGLSISNGVSSNDATLFPKKELFDHDPAEVCGNWDSV